MRVFDRVLPTASIHTYWCEWVGVDRRGRGRGRGRACGCGNRIVAARTSAMTVSFGCGIEAYFATMFGSIAATPVVLPG